VDLDERLTRALRRRLEFPPTPGLQKLVHEYATRAGSLRGGLELLTQRTHMVSFFHGFADRYEGWPVEFLPFLHSGGDACAYGHIIHAPELNPVDYPLAHHCPGDFGGIVPVGRNTREGIRRIIKGEGIRLPGRRGFERVLRLPRSWRYVRTSDGVGIAAHQDHFGRWTPPAIRVGGEDFDIDEWLSRGDAAFRASRFATALWYFKEAWGWQWRPDVPAQVFSRLIATYRALDRPLLARMCARAHPWLAGKPTH
jgi:hypothetical protein